MTVIDDLASAHHLLVDGSISQQEFDQIKRELLGGVQTLPDSSPSVAWVVGRILLIAVGTILVLSVLVYWYATKSNSPKADSASTSEADAGAAGAADAESKGELAWSREEQVMASRFGNTTISTDAMGRRSYFYYNRDRSFRAVSHEGVFVGKWSVEGNKVCFSYDQAPMGTPNPLCVPVSVHMVGDTWTTGKGTDQVTNTIVAGIVESAGVEAPLSNRDEALVNSIRSSIQDRSSAEAAKQAEMPNRTDVAEAQKTHLVCRNALNENEVTVTLNAFRQFNYTFNCVRGDFVVDISGCAPNGAFGLHRPTGAAELVGVAPRWQDYNGHHGGITSSNIDDAEISFSGGFMGSDGTKSTDWVFIVYRLTGAASLKQFTDQSEQVTAYTCQKKDKMY